ncbi:uracil-DNA glycosylase [Fragilaria crotonensis]|nr:uracil-DNA glycosylase [Fragilaria crotonensis]
MFGMDLQRGYEDFIQTLNLTNEPTDIVQEWNAKGKFIYMVLNDGSNPPDDDFQRSIWITLGMSGRFVAASMNHLQSTEPRWVIQLERHAGDADSACPIFYHDPRNFGTLKFSLSAAALHDKLKSLGPDILNVETTTEDLFVELVAAQKSELNVCKFLMNQKKVSGVDQQRSLLRELQLTALQSYQVQGLTRPGGSYRDAEGNKGRFEFQLQCYGRTFCVKGKPVKKEIEGPHGRTIWYTEDQLFMPRTARCDGIDTKDSNGRKANDSIDLNAARDAGPSSATRRKLTERMVVHEMDAGVFPKPTTTAFLRQAAALNATSAASKTITTTVDPEGRLEAGLKDIGWRKALADVLHSDEFRELANFIDEERSQGIEVYPPEDEVFAALNLCPLDSVKVVIVGQDPYHGPGQGHGLSFSVRPGVRPPPSLQNIFKEAQADVGIDLPRSGHLTCWAEQGVLLLNAVLTVRAGEANSHAKRGWSSSQMPLSRR